MKKVFFTFVLTFMLTFSMIEIAPLISSVVAESDSPVHEAVFQKGMSYRHYPYPYDSAESNESLARMAAVGVEYVALIVWWQQENVNSTEIYRVPGWTATDEELKCAVDKIHDLGMKVMLKPMVDPKGYENHWRGEFPGYPKWFDSYRENITNHYASFANANDVELFCIGCEFWSTENNAKQWIWTIGNVTERYAGPITYAVTFDHCEVITWWDSLDYVGIDAYFPLTNKDDPTLEELKEGWSQIAHDLESWQTTVNKPIIFTEIGYRSGNGTNKQPWNWTAPLSLDLQEQVDCYEAAFQVLWNKPWFYGMYWWIWESDPEAGGSNCTDFTPQDKPAQGVITHWYSSDQINYSTLLEQINLLNSTLREQIDALNLTLQTSITELQEWINSANSALTSGQEALINELGNIRNLMCVFIVTTVVLIIVLIIALTYLTTKIKVSKAKT